MRGDLEFYPNALEKGIRSEQALVKGHKLGQALATGNTVILKPAPDTPWNATRLGRLVAEQTDFPSGVLNVVIGTLLIGTMLNGMTIMDISYAGQNLIKGVILLVAILTDSFLNPRNEETAQQGDI